MKRMYVVFCALADVGLPDTQPALVAGRSARAAKPPCTSHKKTVAFAATAAKATNPQECMAATAAMHSQKNS